jgi:tryptophanyl-tRNA synthetase
LVDAQGRLLLQSCAFESPKLAAQTIARLQREGTAVLGELAHALEPLTVDLAELDAALTLFSAPA